MQKTLGLVAISVGRPHQTLIAHLHGAANLNHSRDTTTTRSGHALQRAWIGRGLIGLSIVVFVLLWIAGDAATLALRYERAKVLHGEYWRLFTAHWVHSGFRHMALNAAGAVVIAALFTRTYRIGQWLLVLLASIVAIDIGFLCLEKQLDWYVGASGVLHGALAAGAIAWWRTEARFMAAALNAILIGKLAWEQLQGALPLAGGMPVIVDAHLYGAIGGAMTACLIEAMQRSGHRHPQGD